MDLEDPVVSVIPIQLSSALDPHLQLHQFPLMNRPLVVPPSASKAGRAISARSKPLADRLEIHVPFDTREDVWNARRGLEYGDARAEEDGKKSSARGEHRLEELRLQSERIPHKGVYMLGVWRGGKFASTSPQFRSLIGRCQTVYIFIRFRLPTSSVLTLAILTYSPKRPGTNQPTTKIRRRTRTSRMTRMNWN